MQQLKSRLRIDRSIMPDYTNFTWTMTSLPDENNDAVVEFGCDSSVQTINIPDVSSVEAVTYFLDTYTQSYVTSQAINQAANTNASGLSSLVNVPQTAPDIAPDSGD